MNKDIEKEEIKISNNLLRFVLGCECEFKYITNNDINISMTHKQESKYIDQLENEEIKEILIKGNSFSTYGKNRHIVNMYKTNIHTFIHLAKIKAFSCGYEIIEKSKEIYIEKGHKILRGHNLFSFIKCILKWDFSNKPFESQNILEALEWVTEKVGGEE